jgi:hypothetical protein
MYIIAVAPASGVFFKMSGGRPRAGNRLGLEWGWD